MRLVGDSELGTRLGGHSELGAAAPTKTVWWDLHLASMLTHLFIYLFIIMPNGRQTYSYTYSSIHSCTKIKNIRNTEII